MGVMDSYSQWCRLTNGSDCGAVKTSEASTSELGFGTTLVLLETGSARKLGDVLGASRGDARAKTRFAAEDVAAESERDGRWRGG